MANSADYIDYLLESLADLGMVSAKRMFGGHGLYFEDRMFALVADDVLYLKADGESVGLFEAEGLGPFLYPKKEGKMAKLNYYEAPSAALDDAEILTQWARYGIAAALRAPAPKREAEKRRM